MTGGEAAAGAAAAGGTAAAGLSGAQWAALLASLGGTAASMAGQQQQAQDRRDILNRQAMKTHEAEDKSAAMVKKEGESYQADARTAALAGQEQATYDQSQKDLGAAPTIIEGAGDAGNVSSDYLAAKADTALSEGKRLTAIAKELSKVRAPGQLQTAEGLRRANLAGDLQNLWGTKRNEADAARMDAESVTEPWWGAAGKIAATLGGGYLASGAGGATSAINGDLTSASDWSSAGTMLGDHAGSGASNVFGGTSHVLGDNTAPSSFWNQPIPVRFGQIKFGR